MNMKKKVKRLWVNTLKSREYIQGEGRLRDADYRFCCLGVLCDIYSKETGIGWNGYEFMGEGQALPYEVSFWAGLDDDNPKVGRYTLATHNDGSSDHGVKKKTFNSIANLINRHL